MIDEKKQTIYNFRVGRAKDTDEDVARRHEIAARIEFARKSIGLSKSELADAVGVSRASFTGWISGVHSPSRANLAKLCNVTRQSASFFDAADTKETSDQAAFARELVRVAGADSALALLDLDPEDLRETLRTRRQDNLSEPPAWVALRRSLTSRQLEELIGGILVAKKLDIVDAVVESVASLAKHLSKAKKMPTASVYRQAKNLVIRS